MRGEKQPSGDAEKGRSALNADVSAEVALGQSSTGEPGSSLGDALMEDVVLTALAVALRQSGVSGEAASARAVGLMMPAGAPSLELEPARLKPGMDMAMAT